MTKEPLVLNREVSHAGGVLKLERTLLVGILNVTPDSFSDGGRFFKPGTAVAHGVRMFEDGADLIDIGGESTRPGAEPVPEETELERVMPVIEGIKEKIPGALISIDTYKAGIARAAIRAGAVIVNDISGLGFDKDMAPVVRETGAGLIIMHIKGTPRDMQQNPHYDDLMGELVNYFKERTGLATKAGIAKNKIIIDPGIGFGKKVEHNYRILNGLGELRELGYPVLAGPSRKSFIGQVLGVPPSERLFGTAAAVAACVFNGAQMIRVHDVRQMKQLVQICEQIKQCKL